MASTSAGSRCIGIFLEAVAMIRLSEFLTIVPKPLPWLLKIAAPVSTFPSFGGCNTLLWLQGFAIPHDWFASWEVSDVQRLQEFPWTAYLGRHSHGPGNNFAYTDRVTDSHHELLASVTKSKEKAKEKNFYSYTRIINGFTAILEKEEAVELAKHPDVVSVFPDQPRKLHTTWLWVLLGVERDGVIPESSIFKKGRLGEDVIIGIINTANGFGYGNGTAKGGSPNAHVASYKACWPPINGSGEYFDSKILAAFDAAISDHCDVILLPVGGEPAEFFNDSISIGAFHATMEGILVVASAGNSGPAPSSVSNVGPWSLTVGASTMDREFTRYVTLGNGRHLKGASISAKGLPAGKFYPLISAADAKAADQSAADALLCKAGTLDPKKVKGKVLVCLLGVNKIAENGEQALLAGAVGMILVNDKINGNEIIADNHVLPAVHINFTDGEALFAYINSTTNPVASMTNVKTEFPTKPAPVVPSFSSRGPNPVEKSILKPDITAPGISVIAGIAFHIKALYLEWSPAAIKSAIMTSARTHDNNVEPMLDSSNLKATPFDYGAGHVHPNRALDPGLIYDLTVDDYVKFLCARGINPRKIELMLAKPYSCPKSYSLADFNYPAITVPNLNGSITVTRTVKNVGSPGTYNAVVEAPAGVSVVVKPTSLKFEKPGEEKTYEVSFEPARKDEPKDYAFGKLTLTDGKHNVTIPLVVKHY